MKIVPSRMKLHSYIKLVTFLNIFDPIEIRVTVVVNGQIFVKLLNMNMPNPTLYTVQFINQRYRNNIRCSLCLLSVIALFGSLFDSL